MAGAHLVIKSTFMLVWIAVEGAEQSATAAGKTCNTSQHISNSTSYNNTPQQDITEKYECVAFQYLLKGTD